MSGRFGLYLTDEGAKHVDSDIDMDILRELRTGNKTIGMIADGIGKSRSTVSDRLSRLEKEHIIGTVESDDQRERVYSVIAMRIMDSRDPSASSKNYFKEKVKMIIDGKLDIYEGFGECIFYGAATGGLNICPIFTSVAERIGERVADSCEKNDFFKLSEKLNELFRSNGIGEFKMNVTYFVNVEFTVSEKYRDIEFNMMNNIYRNIIRAALEKNSGKKMRIEHQPSSDLSRFEFKLFFEGMD